jgi:AcrR family transcriptional regulator
MPVLQSGDKNTKYDRKLADILSAAAQVFAEEGYDRASIRTVAERAGVSVAGLYYYVRSKEELLYQIQFYVFDELVQRFKSDGATIGEPQARLELLVRNHLDRFLANMSELIVCSREIDRIKGELGEKLDAKRREYFALVTRLFAELADQHGGGTVDARTAALALFGSINWIYTWYKPGSGPTAAEMAQNLVRLYLRGVLPDTKD